jgi:hypothetical protein
MIFECLDDTLGRVNAVVVWLNEHELAIFVGEEFLDLLRALIVTLRKQCCHRNLI